jgi:hypothetical protein
MTELLSDDDPLLMVHRHWRFFSSSLLSSPRRPYAHAERQAGSPARRGIVLLSSVFGERCGIDAVRVMVPDQRPRAARVWPEARMIPARVSFNVFRPSCADFELPLPYLSSTLPNQE